jgi:hypothetical protein
MIAVKDHGESGATPGRNRHALKAGQCEHQEHRADDNKRKSAKGRAEVEAQINQYLPRFRWVGQT